MSTSRKVLIIEDNADFARVFARYLTTFGHQVEIAATGQEGLDLAEQFLPDVVICDIRLGDIDGWSVANRIQQASGVPRKPLLLALTGFGRNRDATRSQEAGFDLHITKPPDFEKLEQVIANLSAELYT